MSKFLVAAYSYHYNDEYYYTEGDLSDHYMKLFNTLEEATAKSRELTLIEVRGNTADNLVGYIYDNYEYPDLEEKCKYIIENGTDDEIFDFLEKIGISFYKVVEVEDDE